MSQLEKPEPPFKVNLTGPANEITSIGTWLRILGCEVVITPRSKKKYRLRCDVPQKYADRVAKAILSGKWAELPDR